jgi:(1->4)-alpha-D-glucan 1-alpha-D-glucosylmutase
MQFPTSTYRLQFNSTFGFQSAASIIPYLAELGITTIYASPIFQSAPGSTHGYDVVDPNRLNSELGSQSDFENLIEAVKQAGMSWLQDIVPNHMAYHSANSMLMDIFEKGTSSPYFSFFDVVWDHLRLNLRGKLIAPFLGRPYSESLERGELELGYDENGFSVTYYEHKYPLRIESYVSILRHRLESASEQRETASLKLSAAIDSLNAITDDNQTAETRNDLIDRAKSQLWEYFSTDQAVRGYIEQVVEVFNHDVDLLDRVLRDQWFLLTNWRLATKEINYQRFFNVNGLISLRIEDEAVFNYLHRLIFEMLREDKFIGLRVDHVDGLYDPVGYLVKLRDVCGDSYIVVEKILDMAEALPARWPVQGTTGYDFLNYVNGLFCNPSSEAAFNKIYQEIAETTRDWDQLVYDNKKWIIERHMSGDLDNIAYHLKAVSTSTREGIDLTMEGLKKAAVEFSAVFPVYRTYINNERITARDRAYICDAIARAKERNPEPQRELSFLEKVLLLEVPQHIAWADRGMWLSFVMRFQQFTSPLMAKGLEDTCLYLYNRLISLSEVGGNPSVFGIAPTAFHDFNQRRVRLMPGSLNTTSTHDTKRSEDVRARINVLSEMPDEWERQVLQWQAQNRRCIQEVGGIKVPDKNEEYLLYQTLVGAFPFGSVDLESFARRINDYMVKALREAKVHTSWIERNTEYESAVSRFISAILYGSESVGFLRLFRPFHEKVAYYGMLNSLSQTLLKITSPGVPDFYQGTELWDFSLVDPDNRRPVDFAVRENSLRELKRRELENRMELVKALLSSMSDGLIKLYTIYKALKVRKNNKRLFDEGVYIPLEVNGRFSNNLFAFARRVGESWAVVIAPRLMASLVGPGELPVGPGVWDAMTIRLTSEMPARWLNVFTGELITGYAWLSVPDVLSNYPMALLLVPPASGDIALQPST